MNPTTRNLISLAFCGWLLYTYLPSLGVSMPEPLQGHLGSAHDSYMEAVKKLNITTASKDCNFYQSILSSEASNLGMYDGLPFDGSTMFLIQTVKESGRDYLAKCEDDLTSDEYEHAASAIHDAEIDLVAAVNDYQKK